MARKRAAHSKVSCNQPERQRKIMTIAEKVFNSNTKVFLKVYNKSVGKDNMNIRWFNFFLLEFKLFLKKIKIILFHLNSNYMK